MNENIDLSKDAEIDKALKDFEEKSIIEEAKKAPETSKNSDVPKMVGLVMKWMGTDEQKQAEYVLLGFVIITIGVSLYLFFGGNGTQGQQASPEAIEQMRQLEQSITR